MACYHPMFALGKYDIEGKLRMTFLKNCTPEQFETIPEFDEGVYDRKLMIPCGQCIDCRLQAAREWTVRLLCEMKAYKPSECWFVTLTYDPEHLPVVNEVPDHPDSLISDIDLETGELLSWHYSDRSGLSKRDLQLFMKRLRISYQRRIGNDDAAIRFFACGEYGDLGKRPHYHLILFGLALDDLKYYKSNFRGDAYYNSQFLSDVWKKGFVVVSPVTYDNISYTCRYILKKQTGDLGFQEYVSNGIIPPFTLMSRNPGIAREFYDSNKDMIYRYDQVVIVGKDGTAKRVKPAKYFDRLYALEDPEFLASLKEERTARSRNRQLREMEQTDLSALDYLCMKEMNKLEAVKKLVRTLE